LIIALTGGTGFIGKRLLAKHLSLGDEVRVLSRRKSLPESLSKAKLYNCNLATNASLVLNDFFEGVDVFYHCAGEIKDESKMYSVHVEGTKQLIKAASGKIGRWVQLSSVGVYGSVYDGKVSEESLCRPEGMYEETKYISDKLVLEAGKNREFDYVFLQPSAVIANDMSNQSVFQLIRSIRDGRFVFIGKQETILNYTHADNVAHALYLCGTVPQASTETFIVSESITLREMVSIVCNEASCEIISMKISVGLANAIARLMMWKRDFPLTRSRVKALTSKCIYVAEKIEKTLSYHPVIPLEQAMHELVLYALECKK